MPRPNTPLEGLLAIARALLSALQERSSGLAWAYAAVLLASWVLFRIVAGLRAEDLDANLPGRDLVGKVLSRVHAQAARSVVTFTISFAMFSFSLSLGGPAGTLTSVAWLRAFPSLGFAVLQAYSTWRWYTFFTREEGLIRAPVWI